jgi:L-malate glycosyltransferase
MPLEDTSPDQHGLNSSYGESNIADPSINQVPESNRKLRLLYISNPNSIHTRRWINWFVRRGHVVCLLADVPLKEPWSEVQVIDLSKFFYAPIIRFPIWAIWLRWYIRRWRPDILHAHRVNSAGWLAAVSGFHPLVVTPWGSDVMLGPQRSWLVRQLAVFTLRRADKVTVISQTLSQKILELGARPGNLVSIYNGVDFQVFFPHSISTHEGRQFRHELGLHEASQLVFSPRAINPIYNQDIVMHAIPFVRESFPDVCFLFIEYNANSRYKQQLDGLIQNLGLGGLVRWLPAASNPAEMSKRYCLSDVVVSVPGSDGGTPLTIMEAMACGKPVICSDLPANHEFITNGENGWIVPVRQVKLLAEAIVNVLKNPAQAQEIGQKAYQYVIGKVNLDVEMQHMEAVYYQLLGVNKD